MLKYLQDILTSYIYIKYIMHIKYYLCEAHVKLAYIKAFKDYLISFIENYIL